MAASNKMIALGIGAVMDILLLIYSAFIGDKIFQTIFHWVYGFKYTSTPVIDPGIISWIPAMYFGMLIGILFAIIFVMFLISVSDQTNQYGA
jgi:CHASE1-domain containing sensor protein